MNKIDITKLSKEKSQLLILSFLVMIIILAGYFYFFLTPKVAALGTALTQTAVLRKKIIAADDLIANTGKFKSEIAELKEQVGQYETRLPAKKEIASILNQLSGLASREQIKIIGIKELELEKSKDDPKKSAYDEIPIQIDMKSGYHQLARFINQIESSDRLMKIESLKVNFDPRDPGKHTVRIIVSAFVLVKE
ncbi:MAG: type 4a pilus biogenesis protein PilO [Candidatus Omnitrophota bacterium]|nr:type 4a pilus biogenesis protein PilO [Candidatus Omnitrophota bacterium]